MLAAFAIHDRHLSASDCTPAILQDAVWIDLREPEASETARVESSLGLTLPSREQIQRIEESSRLYRTGDGYVMTATVLVQLETSEPERTPITFIINGDRLITVRFADSHAVSRFVKRATSSADVVASPVDITIGIIEAVINRQAELVEEIQTQIDTIARSIFMEERPKFGIRRRYADVLKSVGRQGEIASRSRESLASLQRLLSFLTIVIAERHSGEVDAVRVKAAARDVASLADHIGFLMNKITFLLDATLGLIGIEQNNVVKILSIAAVTFLPPTLIASIYGMNFEALPGLKWDYSLPLVTVLMVVSAVLPLWYMRRRGWL